jgi:hypothetical protein
MGFHCRRQGVESNGNGCSRAFTGAASEVLVQALRPETVCNPANSFQSNPRNFGEVNAVFERRIAVLVQPLAPPAHRSIRDHDDLGCCWELP